MDLIIIRHARPQRVEMADDDGPADPELSDVGWEQARAVAEFLAEESIDHIVASSMTRAHQTAVPLAEMLGKDIELSDDLRESDHNSSHYVPMEEMTLDSPLVKAYMEDPFAMFDEGYEVFRDRILRGFDSIIDTRRGQRVAVFCHGMVTSVYLQVLWGLSDHMKMQPDYTGITRVQASSIGLRTVRSINETAHTRHLLERASFK